VKVPPTPPKPELPQAPKPVKKPAGIARSGGRKGGENKNKEQVKEPSDVVEEAPSATAEASSDGKNFVLARAVDNAAPEKRPAWVDSRPKRTGDVRREVIATEEYATDDECYAAGEVYLLYKTYDHVRQLENLPYQDDLPSITFQNNMILANGQVIATGHSYPYWQDARVRYLQNLGIDLDHVRREIVAKDPKNNEPCEYLETVERSVGPMKKLYLMAEFTPAFDREVKQRLEAVERRGRLGAVSAGAASLLGLIGGVWGLLKLDTITKGYYSLWLFLGVPTAIIGATLLSVLAMTL
jgi:hypothetical protein